MRRFVGGVLCDGIIALNKIEFFEKFRVQLSEVRVHKCIISGVIRVCRTEYSADRVHDFLKVYNRKSADTYKACLHHIGTFYGVRKYNNNVAAVAGIILYTF